MEVEVSAGAEHQAVARVGADGATAVTEERIDGIGSTEIRKPDPAQPKPAAVEEKKPEAAPKEKAADKPVSEEKPQAEPLEDLGDYDGAKPEVVEKFDGRFFTPEGKLHRDNLSAEFWGNGKALKPSTVAFLEDRLGVTPELVKEVCDGLVAKHEGTSSALTARVHELAGGPAVYAAALTWGLSGGYTPEQRARFDTLASKGGPDFEDAVVALVSRHQKATGGRTLPNLPQRRASSPARDATGGNRQVSGAPAQGASRADPTVLPFADAASYRAAIKEAGNDLRKSAEVRARLAVSPFART